MQKLTIRHERLNEEDIRHLQNLCPFQAFSLIQGRLVINEACRLCGICVRQGPPGAVTWTMDKPARTADLRTWQGVAVWADMSEGHLHPVTLELIGKARQLADSLGQTVQVVLAGSDCRETAEELRHYGADAVHIYDHPKLAVFQIEPFTAVLADFIRQVKPTMFLIGATSSGRSLAPRLAARFRTGLTADCTALEIDSTENLVQIRPAYGGNIMARILTRNHRPQLCTVRYKIFPEPERSSSPAGQIIRYDVEAHHLFSRVQVESMAIKERGVDLTVAKQIIAVGRGLKAHRDLAMIEQLADLLQAEIACTRPLIENGWFDPRRQIGLSGRTVSPRLLITVGVSGSVQFIAGMKGAENIIAINTDASASICRIAHEVFVGDLYQIIPRLLESISQGQNSLLPVGQIRQP